MVAEKGWKPIPLSLKILFVVFVLWVVGSILSLSGRYELGLPFFGVYLYGISAAFIVIILDIVAPITFLFALWNRKTWGVRFALTYILIFILNSVIVFFTVREQLGSVAILIPLLFNIIFIGVIYKKREYFK